MKFFFINFFLLFSCFINNVFSWTSATTLTTAVETNASNCSCVVNDNFKGVAVWKSNNILASKTRIGYSLFDGSSWGSRAWLSIAEISTFPSVAINASNKILVVWDNDTGGGIHTVKARYYNGTSWGSVVTISGDSFSQIYPKVSIDSNGNGIAIWDRSNVDTSFLDNIEAAYFDSDLSSWSGTIKTLESGMSSSSQPTIAMNEDGNAIALWIDNSNSGKPTASYYNQSSGWPSGWGSNSVLDTTGAGALNVAINNDDDGFAIWKDLLTADIKVSKYTGTWSSAESLATGEHNGADPDVALNDSGKAIAVWRRLGAALDYIWASNYNGSIWTATVSSISTGIVSGDPIPTVAIDSTGDGIAVFGGDNVQRVAYDTSWQPAANLSALAGATAVVDTTAGGSSMAVWESTGTGIIQASTDEQSPPI